MTVTRAQLIEDTKDYLDAVDSDKWGPTIIARTLNSVYDGEWSGILNAAPYYQFATRSVTTDATGVFPMSDLNSGTGDNQQLWYRIISVADSNYQYEQTTFQQVPTGLTTNWSPVWNRIWYPAGSTIQVLPAAAVTLNVAVNYKPTALVDLADDSSAITFPDNCHFVLVWEAAARLAMKGGEETEAAAAMAQLARDERAKMLADIQRRSIQPMFMQAPDSPRDWGSR